MKVYAASIRRRGEEPPLDYDQPERLELSGGFEIERSAREEVERKLEAVRERLAYHEGDEEPQTNGTG